MGNLFVHAELMSTDVRKSKDFYVKLFDWKLEDIQLPEMPYTMINVGEGTGGGMLKNPMPGAPSSWMVYVLVDDVKAATAKARTLGANVMKDVSEVPDMGWFSIITDPTGAMLGLWQAKTAKKGKSGTRPRGLVPDFPFFTSSSARGPSLLARELRIIQWQ